jgi:hypothetical protein
MSHSTHVGFKAPFNSSGVTMVRSFSRDPLPPHLHSAAPPVDVTRVGVGHSPRVVAFAITAKFVIVFRGPPFIRAFMAKCASGVLPSSCATGVGHNPDAISAVRGADG